MKSIGKCSKCFIATPPEVKREFLANAWPNYRVKARRKARCWLERRGRVMDDIDPRTRAERDWRALMDGRPSLRRWCGGEIVDAELLGALVAAALLLNGLIKIDTADGEKLGCNFQILQCFIFRVAKIDGHWPFHVPIPAFVFREGIARNCVGRNR